MQIIITAAFKFLEPSDHFAVSSEGSSKYAAQIIANAIAFIDL